MTNKVEQRGEEWAILNEEGEVIEEGFTSEEQANTRREQIEAAKAARGSTDHTDTVRRYDTAIADLHCDATRDDGICMHETPEGFLRGDAWPSRVGVQTYHDIEGNGWGELRTEDEVFSQDSMATFELATLTNDHPEQFVNIDNRGDTDMGSVGAAVRDGNRTRTPVLVKDKQTIADIKAGKCQLSCGYEAVVVMEDGVTDDGTPYAGRQTQIRINHVAIVDRGRAGPECRLLQKGDAYSQPKEPIMATLTDTVTVKIDGEEFASVTKDLADKIDTLQQQLEAKTDNSELKAQIDVLSAQLKEQRDGEATRTSARVALERAALTVLDDVRTDTMTDAQLQTAVVLSVLPSMKDKLEENKDDAGYLRCAFDQAVADHKTKARAVHDANTVIFDTLNSGEGDELVDALTKHAKRGEVSN